jgi:hypothetical protein
VLLLLAATPAGAGLLHLESALDSQAPLRAAVRRLEFGSTYYGAEKWLGLRHQLRIAGSRGDQVQWGLTLPWLYSSLANGGRSGRDNLLMGGTLGLLSAAHARLRLGGEFWLPRADADLAPLGERRAYGRLALLGELAGRRGLEFGLSYAWELRGIGPEPEGGPWPDFWDLDLRLGGQPAAGAGFSVRAGGSWQPEGDLVYTWLGAGLALAWDERWLAELSGMAHFGAAEAPSRADYRLRLGLRRDLESPSAAEPALPGADTAPAGEAPPPDAP